MKKYTFEVLGGTHVDEQQKVYEKGDVVVSTSRLDKLFMNKFRRVTVEDAVVENIEKTKLEKEVVEEEADEVSLFDGTVLPEDILAHDENETSEYPLALEKGVFVLRKGSWRYVVDPVLPQEAMHERGLREGAVLSFLEEIE